MKNKNQFPKTLFFFDFFISLKTNKDEMFKPKMLELDSDDTFVKPFHWSSISQAYTRVLHAQDIPKRVLWMCIVMFNSMLKALKHKHTHTHHSPISRLIPFSSRLIHSIVDLIFYVVD